MTDSQLKQDLRAIRALFSGPEKWTKGSHAKDSYGRNCCGESTEAVCWCIWGAPFALFRGLAELDYERITALRKAFHDICGDVLPIWNDAPERTFEDVIALLDKAIEEAP